MAHRLVGWRSTLNSKVITVFTSDADSMKLRTAVLTATVLLIPNIHYACGSALTTAIGPNARMCFYAEVDEPGEKIGVCSHSYAILDCL